MKSILIILFTIYSYSICFSQKIENIRVSHSEQDIILAFDLYPKSSIREKFDLTIKASNDGYTKPLTVKRGKIKDVKPIMRISLVIDGKENFDGYKGELDFKIEATMTHAPIRMTQPLENIEVASGKLLRIAWTGGFDNDKYAIMLFRKESFVRVIKSGHTGNYFNWMVPDKIPTGSGFRIKLVPTLNAMEPDLSNDFTISKN